MLTLAEVKETFEFLDDWEDRYRYIIDLGKGLPNIADELRAEENLVKGCQSLVWIVISYEEKEDQVTIQLDSDAFIVRGLIAILMTVFQRQSPSQIVDENVEELFAELDLLSHLSPTRGNGLRSMVSRIKREAQGLLDQRALA
ncbi:MAG: SufE family protein [Gammaproteobacteria bacterium]|nr:SufE family protein [Gammaproteobacteria bacterium]